MSVEEDAAAYHAFVSAAVDITSVDVVTSSQSIGHEMNLKELSSPTTHHIQTISFVTSSRDLDTNSRRSFLHSVSLVNIKSSSSSSSLSSYQKQEQQHDPFIVPTHTIPMEIPTKIKIRCVSPSGQKVALLVEETDSNNVGSSSTTATNVLEIWSSFNAEDDEFNNHNNTSSEHDDTLSTLYHTMSLIHRIILPTKKLHGKILLDSIFNGPMSLSWNDDETCIAYCAERLPTKVSSFFQKEKQDIGAVMGGEYTLGIGKFEDYGEALVGINPLVDIYIVDIRTGKVGSVSNSPSNQTPLNLIDEKIGKEFTLTQVHFTPDGKHVVYVGLDAGLPRRLGLIHCMNRRSWIFCSKVENLIKALSDTSPSHDDSIFKFYDTDLTCLTNHCFMATSPRFSFHPSNPQMIYLASPPIDTHSGNVQLHIAVWNSDNIHEIQSRILVDQYSVPAIEGPKVLGMGFPGLFCSQLPLRCFTYDGKYVFANSQWGSASKIIQISTKDGSISYARLKCPRDIPEAASESILYVTKTDEAIFAVSEPSLPAKIGIISLKSLNDNDTVIPRCLSTIKVFPVASTRNKVGTVIDKRTKLSYQVLCVNIPQGSEDVTQEELIPIQGILLLPHIENSSIKKFPLIVVPHGGPHSCSTTTYMPMYSFLCQQGRYAILHVNYRGSTGFGKAALESITGKIGSQDVNDVMLLTEATLERNKQMLDPDRVGICGGSHGGFLGAHMIGQYPDVFKVACLRNPVTNIATMVTSTDIPDWTYIESLGLGKYNWEHFSPPSQEMLVEMYDRSPCKYYENIKAPTLIALGLADKRVPPSQGLEYFYSLRSKGVKTKLLVYDEDNHAISKPVSEADHWINIKLWFDENL